VTKLIRFAYAIDRFNLFFLRIAAWLCLILVFITFEQVFSRYLLNESSIAIQELEWHLFAAIFLFAAAGAYKFDDHVRVDLFYSRFSPKSKAIVDTLGIIFFVLPVSAVLIYFGIEFTQQALTFTNERPSDYYSAALFSQDSSLYSVFAALEDLMRSTILVGESSPNPGGLEARWLPKAMIPTCGFLLILQGISQLIKNLREIAF